MWFSARAVSVNGQPSPLSGVDSGRHALDGVPKLVKVPGRIPVLDRAADGARLGDSRDGGRGNVGLLPVAVLEVDGEWEVGRGYERLYVLRHLVQSDVSV